MFMGGILFDSNASLQIVSGRHRQATSVLHHLIGAAAVSASLWRKSNLFMKNVVKGMELFGVPCFRIHSY